MCMVLMFVLTICNPFDVKTAESDFPGNQCCGKKNFGFREARILILGLSPTSHAG